MATRGKTNYKGSSIALMSPRGFSGSDQAGDPEPKPTVNEMAWAIVEARETMPPGYFDDTVGHRPFEEQYVMAMDWHKRHKPEVESELWTLSQKYYLQEKARQDALRRIAAEVFAGTEVLTWEDLETTYTAFLVQDFVPLDSICFLVARPNLGKTFAYIDLVCRMAFGMKWLGKETRQAKTIIVLGEGRSGFLDRIKAWCDAHGKDIEHLKTWVKFVDGANLNNDQSLQILRDAAADWGAELLVLDTWANVHGGASEDDAATNSITLNNATTIAPGAALLFIHHPRKSDEESEKPIMRGSSALNGRADVVMTMYRDKKYIPSSGGKRDWIALSTEAQHAGKNRTGRRETVRGIYLEEWAPSAVLRQLEDEAISASAKNVRTHLRGSMTREEYATASGLHPKTAARHLEKAVLEGVAIVDETARPKRYTLSPEYEPKTPDVAAIAAAHFDF